MAHFDEDDELLEEYARSVRSVGFSLLTESHASVLENQRTVIARIMIIKKSRQIYILSDGIFLFH